jgi:hypothetical protein
VKPFTRTSLIISYPRYACGHCASSKYTPLYILACRPTLRQYALQSCLEAAISIVSICETSYLYLVDNLLPTLYLRTLCFQQAHTTLHTCMLTYLEAMCIILVYMLQNMMLDIIHKDNEPTMRDKLLKDSDNWITASRLYVSAKRIFCYCQKGSLFEKSSGRFNIQERQNIRVKRMQKVDWKLSLRV